MIRKALWLEAIYLSHNYDIELAIKFANILISSKNNYQL